MFNIKLFGYDKKAVDSTLDGLNGKIISQQKDIDYLRNENSKLSKRIQDFENVLEK